MESPLHVAPLKQKDTDKGDKEDQAARWTQSMSEEYLSEQSSKLDACWFHHSECWTAFRPDCKSDHRFVSQTLAQGVCGMCLP